MRRHIDRIYGSDIATCSHIDMQICRHIDQQKPLSSLPSKNDRELNVIPAGITLRHLGFTRASERLVAVSVLGEGVISIVTAVLQSAGVGVASCCKCTTPSDGYKVIQSGPKSPWVYIISLRIQAGSDLFGCGS